MAVKHIYIDPAYIGTSDGTYSKPYKYQQQFTYNTGDANLQTGDECVIHYKRGYVYVHPYSTNGPFTYSMLAAQGFILVEPYGDAELPPTAFTGWHIKPGVETWVYLGAGVWKLSFARDWSNSSVVAGMRLFAGGKITGSPAGNGAIGTGYKIGVALARASVSNLAVDIDDASAIAALHTPTGLGYYREWLCTVEESPGPKLAYLYVYTGSPTVDPASFYDGLVLTTFTGYLPASGGHGHRAGLQVTDCTNMRITGIDSVFAARGADITTSTSTTSNIIISDCKTLAFAQPPRLIGSAANKQVVASGFRNMLVDGRSTIAEESNYRMDAYTYHGVQDGLQINGYTDSCFAEGVEVRDIGHGAFQIGTNTGTPATVNARLIDCSASLKNVFYGYCLSLLSPGAGNTTYIDRFVGRDSVNFIHGTGVGTALLRDCSFARGTRPYPSYDKGYAKDETNPGNSIDGIGLFSSGDNPISVENRLVAERCTFIQPYGWMLVLDANNYTAFPTGAAKFTNCVFVDTEHINKPEARNENMTTGQASGTSIALYRSGAGAGQVQFTNCYYWTGLAGQNRVMTGFGPVVTTTFAGTSKISGTLIEIDPLVESEGHPRNGSPLLGLVPTNGLTRDASGVYRDVMSAIGAYEYVKPRLSRI